MSRSFRTLSILPLLVGCADYSMSTNAMGDMGICLLYTSDAADE